jgi:hypothetical protein
MAALQKNSTVITDDYQKIKNADASLYRSVPWMTKYEFDQLIGLEVDDVECIVRLVRDKQTLAFGIDGQMIKLARDTLQWDRLHEHERFGLGRK